MSKLINSIIHHEYLFYSINIAEVMIGFVERDKVLNEDRLLLLFYIFVESRPANSGSNRKLGYYDHFIFTSTSYVYALGRK